MSRPYPNSDAIQPRYAAWLGSLGLPVSDDGIAAVRSQFGPMRNVEFMRWIGQCRQTAPAECFTMSSITDHGAFTEHCWREAFARSQSQASA